ncbi:flavin reductase family protein [Arthrobacter mobilis]|uniref:flavin reductase family protein n=1 Tax=Arthrobacter mobilis TaxID=2724944 RepID=UPI00197B5BDD|nr:flavin reductase family protein [Arthrobacter mobilis]
MTAQLQDVSSGLDARELRNTFGNFATGVTVVTYEHEGQVLGATVNSFTSVSMEPALVLVSLMRSSKAGQLLDGRPFAINILNDAQHATALQFAGKPQDGHAIEWNLDGEAPRLADSLAWFTCRPWRQYDGGDHVLVVGEVAGFGHRPDAEPLVFYRGGWRAVS